MTILCKQRSWIRTPHWLAQLTNLDEFPLRKLLKDSLYYPNSGCDNRPIQFLGGFIHSFIYADSVSYGSEGITLPLTESHPLSAYRLFLSRDVMLSELIPSGWQQKPQLPDNGDFSALWSPTTSPFAIWTVFDRLPEFNDSDGPARYSILHIHGDGDAVFDALYNAQQIQPDILVIAHSSIPHIAYRNSSCSTQQALARVALDNKGGKPRYLLHEIDGWHSFEMYWPNYKECIEQWRSNPSNFVLDECNNPDPDEEDVLVTNSAVGGDYIAEGGIRRRLYQTFKRNRDESF
jgi:hypothetical protein